MGASVHRMEGGIMPIFGNDDPCPFGCTYCHAKRPEITAELQEKPEVTDIDQRVNDMLQQFGRAASCVFGTRVNDIFGKNPMNAIPSIERLASYGANVSLLTKASLPPAAVDALMRIDADLQERTGKRIVTEFSLVSGRNRPDLEPHAPPVQERIDCMSTLAHRNLRVAVCISPSLPSSIVSDAETRELIDRTADVVPAYTLDKGFYWLTSMAKALGLQDSRELLSRSFTSNHLPCGIGGEQTLWNIFKSPRWRDITRYIEDKGLAVFHQSSKTVRYLAQYREPAFAPSVSAF